MFSISSARNLLGPCLAVAALAGCEPTPLAPAPQAKSSQPTPAASAPAPSPSSDDLKPTWKQWDLSATTAAESLGQPDTQYAAGDKTELFWRGSGRLVIQLPHGRTIDVLAESLTATLLDGKVVRITFNSRDSIPASSFREIMVNNIKNLRLRVSADEADAIRVLDRWLTSHGTGYSGGQSFGSRDGDPVVEVQVRHIGFASSAASYSITYDLSWNQDN
jgi:hypothetical protein